MKTAIGYFAILLGGAGLILSAAAAALIWWVGAELKDRTDKVTAQADQGLGQVEEALGRIQDKVKATTDAVEGVRASAADIERGAEVEPPVAARIKGLLNDLTPLLERAATVGESLRSVAAVLQSAATVSEQIGKDRSKAERLRSIADSLTTAAGVIDKARDRIDALRRGDVGPTAAKLVELANLVQPPLNQVAARLADVRRQSEEAREELAELRREAHFWAVAGPALLDVVLLWGGLGQLALIGWGRRRVADR